MINLELRDKMALKFNGQVEAYKLFRGRSIDQMPLLLRSGRIPLSVHDGMILRLDIFNSNNRSDILLVDNYFDTGDGAARNFDGRMKVVYGADKLRNMNFRSKLSDGGLLLTKKEYNELEVPEFRKEDLDKYTGRSLTKEEVVLNPLWQALARDDLYLFREYVDMVFSEIKGRFGYSTGMGLYLPYIQKKPIMMLWCIGGLNGRADAGSGMGLNDNKGCLIGVLPKPVVRGLENRVRK